MKMRFSIMQDEIKQPSRDSIWICHKCGCNCRLKNVKGKEVLVCENCKGGEKG